MPDMIWIHSFNSSTTHTKGRCAQVMFFEMIYQPYEHNSPHQISGIKTTFLLKMRIKMQPSQTGCMFIDLEWADVCQEAKR